MEVRSHNDEDKNPSNSREILHDALNVGLGDIGKIMEIYYSQQEEVQNLNDELATASEKLKVCIFAYGQTSSGKTYSMMGKNEPPEEKGLIPRSLEHIFVASQSLGFQGLKYTIQASMLEIYNENIRDLLLSSRPDSVKMSCNKQFTIKKDKAGNTHVPGLTVIDVHNIEDVSVLLKQATQNRTVGKTRMNEESSRRHFVFILRISRGNDAINTSLAALGDVISSIAKKEPHVPYRNSKLTYLLKQNSQNLVLKITFV
ncbi:Kinesin-5 [Platanthera guangdongensis]|uniref:Kinesin-5 n=1 Tax=Platanthera guangdongensis TaxID=2320717 RepID=A0ABR2M6U6_9ASPA